MRKYQTIWEALKKHKTAKVITSSDTVIQKRVIQAVKKEKCYDIPFKVLCGSIGNTYKLHYVVEGNEITFFLLPELSSKNL